MKKVNNWNFSTRDKINEWYKDHQDCQIINIETHTSESNYSTYKVWYIEEEK